ncbi:MAG: cytochrome c-type biogenesis protein [Lysobacterales bacterium]
MKRLILLVALLLAAGVALAQEPLVFEDAAQEERYNALTLELRCTVCQNQSLADSDAPLAQDLRAEIYDMMMAGRSDEEIKTFMIERYGDFVLYRPPVQGNTFALWVIPLALLLLGAVAVFFVVRNHNRNLAARREEESA